MSRCLYVLNAKVADRRIYLATSHVSSQSGARGLRGQQGY